ncbi:MAG: hypothetical protein WCF85_22245, partial [Rhodospirillaceae bacterium]
TGKMPPSVTERVLEDRVPAPSALGVSIPADIEQVLLAGLAMRPQNRLQSMKALLAGFARLQTSS